MSKSRNIEPGTYTIDLDDYHDVKSVSVNTIVVPKPPPKICVEIVVVPKPKPRGPEQRK
jgi:hypothetical protein